jgi:hypothetical protein
MIELTDQQLDELKQKHEFPARILNPRTKEHFRLIPEELYERVRIILEQEDEIQSVREMYPLVNQVLETEEKPEKESA